MAPKKSRASHFSKRPRHKLSMSELRKLERGSEMTRLLTIVKVGSARYLAVGRFWRDSVHGDLVRATLLGDGRIVLEKYIRPDTDLEI